MAIKITADKISAAQAKRPDAKAIPPKSFKITSFWRKEDKYIKPFVVEIINWNPLKDELVSGQYVESHHIDWLSEKGAEIVEGNKVWYVTEGVYKSRSYAKEEEDKPIWQYWAVDDKGKGEEITADKASEIAAEANGKTFQPKPRQHGAAGETPEKEPEV
jgi:hypothetical protein